jgi:hypothetical protein
MAQPRLAKRGPPACPLQGREVNRGSLTSPVTTLPQVSISAAQDLDRRPIFQSGLTCAPRALRRRQTLKKPVENL